MNVITLIKPSALVRRFSLSSVLAPPIGLAYIAGSLKKNGIDYNIIDATGENLDQTTKLSYIDGYSIGLTNSEVVERIDSSTDIIGLSCMFSSSWTHDLNLIQLIKMSFPQVKIVLGGEHATACSDYILKNCPDVDFCVLGEGENTFLELINAIRAHEDLSTVPGIAFLDNDKVVTNASRKRISEVDSIPLPDWEKVPVRNYMERGIGHGATNSRSMPLLASRGCPYQCTFCSSPQMWTTKWIARDPKSVVDEMEYYIKEYQATNFDLFDLTAIIRKDWIVQFAKEIVKRDLNINYQLPSGTRSEAIDAEVAKWLKKSGCLQLNYAPESGSENTLKIVKKRVKLKNLESSMKDVIGSDIKVMCNIILFPHEGLKDILKTFRFMLRSSYLGLHDITFVPFVPYPGTELYDNLRAKGELPPLSNEYFNSLLIHSDLSKVNSYNKNFGPKATIFLRLLFLFTFYSSNYLFRPHRFFIMIKNVARGTPQTRGEDGLRTLFRKLMKA